ncbi:odorant receptor 49b-like [Odontomachus brunneus]|uniref:odorant receptor 49b-like n=1 Tax=Odontomachus brunneus TaxID=486640 RepID=UPI0013F17F72|nr:odorant receptor 49b-like [Odontomachus brunneus]
MATWTIYEYSDDSLLVMKLGCQLGAILQIPLQMILFAAQDERLQLIVLEMEDYNRRAGKYEKEIFQRYIDKCWLFYGMMLTLLMMTAAAVIFTPVFMPQPFPADVRYPFNVLQQPFRTIMYAHHIVIAFQSAMQVSANTFPALLLWFVAARFDILSMQLRMVTDVKELIKCTREHYELLRYAEEVALAIRYIALLCVTFSTGVVIFGCLTFMSRYSWSVKAQFLMMAMCGFMELYMYAWPADNVINTSGDVALAAYSSPWYNDDLIAQKILIYVILRSQRPVTISIPCALPTLSMNYYTSYISTVFSYMTLIRIIMDNE